VPLLDDLLDAIGGGRLEIMTKCFAKYILVIAAVFMFAATLASRSEACPAGTHPYGGYGSRHAGGGCY
jgi:hypothetical protein